MLDLPKSETAYWKSLYVQARYPVLDNDLMVDVAIVGGGIAALTAAYLLKQAGLKVAVVEKHKIGSGTTGGTTGKITSQHGLVYADLYKRLGSHTASVYAQANQMGVELIATLIEKNKIDCDWQRDDNYVYTSDPSKVDMFKRETEIAKKLGLPVTFETQTILPFEITGAVKFANQAKFDAQKYVLGLAALVDGDGSYVFENSNVISIRDGKPASIGTKKARVTAKDIIVATKMPAAPLLARTACAAVEYPTTSYIVAATYDGNLKGMYISPDKHHYSILPITSGGKKILLIGGEKHIPGLGSPTKRHAKLARYAEEHFDVSSIDYRWKAMDYLAYDDVPLIGKVYPWSKHLYTATGFHKWGLSTSMVAGIILRDLITGQPNPWAATFNTMRAKPLVSVPHAISQYLK